MLSTCKNDISCTNPDCAFKNSDRKEQLTKENVIKFSMLNKNMNINELSKFSYEGGFGSNTPGNKEYHKSRTVQTRKVTNSNENFIRNKGKPHTIETTTIPNKNFYEYVKQPVKQENNTHRSMKNENIENFNTLHYYNNHKYNDTEVKNILKEEKKIQYRTDVHKMTNNSQPSIEAQMKYSENVNKYRETKKYEQHSSGKQIIKKLEKAEQKHIEDNGDVEKDEEEETEEDEEDENVDDDEEEEYEIDENINLENINWKYGKNKANTELQNKNVSNHATKKLVDTVMFSNSLKKSNNSYDTQKNEKNKNKEKIHKNNSQKNKQYINVNVDSKSSFFNSEEEFTDDDFSTLSKISRTSQKEINKKIIKSKLRVVKIILKFLFVCKKNLHIKSVSPINSHFSNSKKKKRIQKIIVQGPFLPKKEEPKIIVKEPGYIPKYLKEYMENVSVSNKIEKNKRMILKKHTNKNVYQLFQNMIVLDVLGKLHTWNGFSWDFIDVPYDHFTSITTNDKGQLLCVDHEQNPGYLMNSRHFNKIKSWQENYIQKIVIDQKNKMWGINLLGDIIKWNKYSWITIRKAYGISKAKSIAFSRKNELWVLDINNYFFVYNILQKKWRLKNIMGNNIKDFDFDENNYLVAVTEDGMIKLHKNKKWIKYGILGQMKTYGVHFNRQAYSANPTIIIKNEESI